MSPINCIEILWRKWNETLIKTGGSTNFAFDPGYPLENRGYCQPSVAGKKHKAVKAAKTGTEEKSFHKTYYISCRRPVTEAERNQALEAAHSFTLNTPFCFIKMKPSHVYHTFWVVRSLSSTLSMFV